MKLIIAIIQPEELPEIKEELIKRKIYKFTVTNAKGQGKEIKDAGELERYWEVKEFNTPKMHEGGDMVVWRGQNYASPPANEWGPRGSDGPKWGSSFTGD